jgi:hypothetical protein
MVLTMALPKKKIKSDRPSNPIKKKQTPKAPALKDAFKNPLSKKSNTYNEATGKGKINTRRPLDDYGIYGRPRSLNKRDKI